MNYKKISFYSIIIFILFLIFILTVELSISLVTKSSYEDQTNLKKKYLNLISDYNKQSNDPNPNFYLVVDYKYYIDNKFNDNYSHYPLSNISNSKTIFCKENGHFKSIISDKFGFNNNNETYQKQIDTTIIGDSFGYGSCVDTNENVSGNLNNLGLITLNFSSSGNGLISNYAIFREYVSEYKPKNVLLFWYEGNDFHNTQDEYNSINLRRYIENKNFSQNLISKQEITDNNLQNFYEDLLNSENFVINEYELNFLELITLKNIKNVLRNGKIIIPNPYLFKNYNDDKFYENIIKDILYSIKNDVNNWGGNVIIVYLPDYWRYEILQDANLSTIRDMNYLKKKDNFLKIINHLNLKYLDFENILNNTNNPLTFFDNQSDPHYNKKGYQFLSNIIYNFLSSQ